jgi:hypothetical protein
MIMKHGSLCTVQRATAALIRRVALAI